MAWAPSTCFEDELVSLQPDYNFIHGQLVYETRQKQEFTPRPQSTYEHLAKREKRNKDIEKLHESKSTTIRASLAMMERIQEIAGTKPLGEHATMSDWDDKSNVEREAVAMMRHFGMMSMSDGSLETTRTDLIPQTKIHVVHNGHRKFPLIMDPDYFEPGKTRKTFTDSRKSASTNSSIYSSALEANNASDSLYITAQTYLDNNNDTSSSESNDSYVEIPYLTLLNELDEQPSQVNMKNTTSKRKNRTSQRKRRMQQKLDKTKITIAD